MPNEFPFQTWIVWGHDPAAIEAEVEVYSFRSKRELDAFKLGVAEAVEWTGHRTGHREFGSFEEAQAFVDNGYED